MESAALRAHENTSATSITNPRQFTTFESQLPPSGSDLNELSGLIEEYNEASLQLVTGLASALYVLGNSENTAGIGNEITQRKNRAQLAQQKLMAAAYTQGWDYAFSNSPKVVRDLKKGIELLIMATNLGSYKAADALRAIYAYSKDNDVRDLPTAKGYLIRAQDLGSRRAQDTIADVEARMKFAASF